MKYPAQFIKDRSLSAVSGTVSISTSCAHDLPHLNSSALGGSIVVSELRIPHTMPST